MNAPLQLVKELPYWGLSPLLGEVLGVPKYGFPPFFQLLLPGDKPTKISQCVPEVSVFPLP